MRPIIRVSGLGKRYRLGQRGASYETLRESLTRGVARLLRGRGRRPPGAERTFWALKDVSFEVRPGEVVGIIGRNGAGKSTLLKVLSRVTEPSEGEVDLYGRIGSLLEVGTGFHPELTGRENIYLNGAILGMRRAEIAGQFDQIVAFAEVEDFLDTPVKFYSSGMYVRLAFAVAAHLRPEILVVDEVLAVGDANFQKKCLGKLEEVGAQGRTVLFVTHNMPMVHRLCQRAILLHGGRVLADGRPDKVTRQYLSSGAISFAERVWPDVETAPGNDTARLHAVRVLSADGELADTHDIRRPIRVEFDYWCLRPERRPTVSLWLYNEDGICLLVSNDFNDRAWWRAPRRAGLVRSRCQIPGNFLAEGRFFVTAALGSYNPNEKHLMERDVVAFQVVDESEGDAVRGEYAGPWPGVVRPWFEWSVTQVPTESAAPRGTPEVTG